MGFPRLLSIFYSTFHPIQGPKVLYEVPEGSILSKTSPLVDFDSISEYLIPKVELCSKLVTITTPTCKVIGFPVNLEHKKFQRNALMFNLAFVFDKDAETSSYEPVVRKMAKVLKALEKENEFLSRQTRVVMASSGAIGNGIPYGSTTTPQTPAPRNTTNGAPVLDSQINGQSNVGNAGAIPDSGPNNSINESNSNNLAQGQTVNGTSASSSPFIPSTATTIDPVSNVSSQGAATQSTIQSSSGNILPGPIVSSPPTNASGMTSLPLVAPSSSSPLPPSRQQSTTSAAKYINQDLANGSGIQSLIEQLIEDLNSYCECQIPIDSNNTINLKLFPTYPNPAPVFDYQVPISTVNLEALTDVNWDMTMQRITGYINGVNSVKRIAEYADVETGLARMCMQHLLYYGCIIMVDLFQFKNIYAVKLEMMRLTEDISMQNECVSYVTLPDMHAPSFAKVFSLYCTLQYGVVLQDWIEQNQIADFNIDVRAKPTPDGQNPATSDLMTPGSTSRPGTPSTTSQGQKKLYGDPLTPSDQNVYGPYPTNSQYNNESLPNNAIISIPPALKR
ncbi:Nitrogen permease regulator 2 [Entomortierella beljakovae]|nr:Nitrogen permease regulator 2 [Entomortierella beljakovae]